MLYPKKHNINPPYATEAKCPYENDDERYLMDFRYDSCKHTWAGPKVWGSKRPKRPYAGPKIAFIGLGHQGTPPRHPHAYVWL